METLLKDSLDAKPLEMVTGFEKRLRQTERKDLPLFLNEDEAARLIDSLSGQVRDAFCAGDLSDTMTATWFNTRPHPETDFVVFSRNTVDDESGRGIAYWPDGRPYSFYDLAIPE